ncbi:4-hydroxy-tetrahydrodipicolinate synthase [Quadrisphaera oryzae]|uniref:4-hydroxy-tetrahydrodipicolinate synthase n=1 Tax=Quadrisphaera TaxID=317661 RepID=UPI0021036C3C|nr:4-hydroxy-tetrahydrodipicolinate synthase [Quadrisphaera sp. RL12-1S]
MTDAATAFGRNLVAMVTPMLPGGAIDEASTAALVEHLVAAGCDGVVVGGTTGEAPTLRPDEHDALVGLVSSITAGRARVIAGVGTPDTAATVGRAHGLREVGADALLLVCPYYSRPSQAGIAAHCRAVADAADLPVMLYDVPARTGTTLERSTLVELAAHPRILGIKDARGDLHEAMAVMASTSLAYYCGIDELNLAYLACGATGVLSVTGNVVADRNAALIADVRAGRLPAARRSAAAQVALAEALLRTSPPAVMAKAALVAAGVIAHAAVRSPMVEAPAAHLKQLREALRGLDLAA